mgnify:CR=1 FL=1
MNTNMFCYQCEQTVGCTGCTGNAGVCGKKADGIGYGDSYEHAKAVIARLLDNDPRVLKDPNYFIALTALNSSSVDIVVRAWVKAENYWGVFFDMNEKVYKTFAEENLNIPFPQMDVHLYNEK